MLVISNYHFEVVKNKLKHNYRVTYLLKYQTNIKLADPDKNQKNPFKTYIGFFLISF